MIHLLLLIKYSHSQDKIIEIQLQQRLPYGYQAILFFDSLKYITLIDTGSSKLVAKGWKCQGQPLVRIKTEGNKNCKMDDTFFIQYGQGRIEGVHCNVKFKNKRQFNYYLPIFTKCQASSFKKIQAIMGLFVLDDHSFLNKLAAIKEITNKEISLYLTLPKGKLILGDAEILNADYSKPSFTGTYKDSYTFKFVSLSFNKKQKKVNNGKILIDTGNSVTFINSNFLIFLWSQVSAVLKNDLVCQILPSLNDKNLCHVFCQNMTQPMQDLIPDFGIKFQREFVFKRSQFLFCFSSNPVQKKCFLQLYSRANNPNQHVIGANIMKDMLILVDEKAKQFNLLYVKKK